MNANQTYKGKRVEEAVKGHPCVYKVWHWCKKRSKYVDPRSLRSSRAKPFRATKRVRVLGKSKRLQAKFDTLDEAKAWQAQLEEQTKLETNHTYVIENLVDEWRQWSRPPRFAQSTWETYGREVRHMKLLDDVPVEDLRAEDIDAWLQRMIDPSYPKAKSRTSFYREVNVLTTILNWYREYKNPRYQPPVLKRHRVDCVFKRKMPGKDVALSEAHIESFLERLRERHKPVYFYLAAFQVFCGARVGEACGLTWEAVDFEHNLVDICRTCCWVYRTKEPYLREGTKTGENRKVVLPPRLVALLREWKSAGSAEGPVFHDAGNLLRYNAIQSAYKKAFRALGLPERSTHVLRHSFASIHANQTKDIRATQAALGHRDLRVTQHYAKVGIQTQRNAVDDFRFGQEQKSGSTPPSSGGKVILLRKKNETETDELSPNAPQTDVEKKSSQ